MRHIVWIISLVFLISCKEECNEAVGKIIQKEIVVTAFDEIIVNSGIQLTIREAEVQQVIVEAGENKFDNVHTSVSGNTLELQADDSCFFNPTLDAVKVFVSSPSVKLIRNSSEYEISSDGILNYPNLQLISEDHESDYGNYGNFNLHVNSHNLSILSNGLSVFAIRGNTTNLGLYYYSGIGKFEGRDLIADFVTVYHRGDNSIKVNPQQSLKGGLYGTGDLISYNRPPIVEISEHFMGKLIFE